MAARGTFVPSGAHELEIDLGMSGVLGLTAEQARRMKQAIEAFEIEAMRIDGHTDLTNRVSKTLGEF
jgi:hypothetical protein